jgi:hypothetical protein
MVKLHNYLIDISEGDVPPSIAGDLIQAEMDANGVVALEGENHVPNNLLGGGEHFDDLPDEHQQRVERRYADKRHRFATYLII